ncbi:hypothetical protein SBA5_30186 [Candidatus Sulfotelmatomonas gaucii]|uniref:Uncharacterized protein n=1 Tax=Candidatus Sulfuritelmatomonas gaucii TaxID=2043161 RepID=A0A2N9LCF9_9BACT|nr:hypothetical protein SBA5_30186 [Candidatus Sulfotelmatomonas gaucii]
MQNWFPTEFCEIFAFDAYCAPGEGCYIEISGFPAPAPEFYRRAFLVHNLCDRGHSGAYK